MMNTTMPDAFQDEPSDAASTPSLESEALVASELRYRRLFEAAKDGILILDAETGVVMDVNPFLLDLLGYSYEDFVGKAIWDLGFFKDIVANQDNFAELQQKEYIRYNDKPLEASDGRRRDVEFISNVYLENHQKIIQCNIRDITGQRHLEAQLRQAQKMEAVGRLAGGVAHDFNNMLGIILGYTEVALNLTKPDGPLFANLQEIQKAAERSAKLTQQLLAFARKQAIAPKIIDLNDAVIGMLKMLQRLIREEISLVWRPGANLAPINVDPSQIDQILVNLCLNARDVISGAGRITLETGNVILDAAYCAKHADAVPGAYVSLAVSDDGCGMDKETLSHIFEPFFTTKESDKGTGLGLATVYGIVKQNKGFIDACSQPGQGATFRIYLPQVVAKDAQSTVAEMEEAFTCRGETILLAEDEPALRTVYNLFLTEMGYQVLVAENSENAVALAARHPGDIQLLMTDVVMPGMNGRQLAEKIYADRPGIKVLFMSGYTADVMAERGVLEKDATFIAKPFSYRELARKIHDTLETVRR